MPKRSALDLHEMMAKYDVTSRTLRHYEYMEIISSEKVEQQRYYDGKQQIRFELSLRGRQFGMRLEDIRVWLNLYDSCGKQNQYKEWLRISAELEEKLFSEIRLRENAVKELKAITDTVKNSILFSHSQTSHII